MGRMVAGMISSRFGLLVAIFVLWVSIAVMGIGCGPGLGSDVVIVVVGPIPVLGESLQVLAMQGGTLAHERPMMPLGDAKGRSEFSLGLQVPAGLSSPLELTAGVRDKSGCLIAVGSASTELSMMGAGAPTIRIELSRVLPPGDTACSDRVPLILSISPRAASAVGQNLLGERVTPTLQGWGVTTGARWFIDDVEVPTERVLSSFQAKEGVPSSALGPHKAKVRVRNPNGEEHSRGDLFAYMATTISFASPDIYKTAPAPKDIRLADFNGDGLPDIALACAGVLVWLPGSPAPNGGQLQVFFNQGMGRLNDGFALNAGRSPQQITSADFNHDGNLDLAYRTIDEVRKNTGSNSVILSLSLGVFINSNPGMSFNRSWESLQIETSLHNTALSAIDLNGDKRIDIISLCENGPDYQVRPCLFTNNGDGTFIRDRSSSDLSALGSIHAAISSDMNNDGIDDMVLMRSQLIIRVNQGQGIYRDQEVPMGHIDTIYSLAIADLDGDGYNDIVTHAIDMTTGINTLVNQIAYNDGAGGFRVEKYRLDYLDSTRFMLGDLNGDYLPDIVHKGLNGAGGLNVIMNAGRRRFVSVPQTFPVPKGLTWGLADMNNDGAVDLLASDGEVSANNESSLHIYINSSK